MIERCGWSSACSSEIRPWRRSSSTSEWSDYGYQRFNWQVTLVATLVIILLVQASQFFGNWLARKALRR